MSKRILVGILIIVSIFMITGCNSKNKDNEIINELSKNICILVKNKIDIIENFYDNQDANFIDDKYKFCRKHVTISAKNNTGIKDLEQAIIDVIAQNDLMPKDEEFVINSRHKEIFENVQQCLTRAYEILQQKQSEELAALDIREALEIIGQITGKYNTEDMLGKIFSQFCVGK